MAETPPLRLLAQDASDLEVLSAAVQDAVAKIGDIRFEPTARLLTLTFNRYRWEAGGRQRVRSALQVAGVTSLKTRNIKQGQADGVIVLLELGFEPGEAPGGALVIRCAGDGDLRVEVECIEAVLADLSPAWPTPRIPAHKS